ncbi:MAG: 30S ribosomal protein S4 [Patescibacteria group bacterium]|nr:MAG: 30S ribosomal protein S4 [Patescibacteria group bacterium]
MGRYTGPKDRLSRREGVDLFGKGAKLTRLNIAPGVHGAKIAKSQSYYGRQLREKQKVKRIYGVRERQFKNYVEKALKSKGNTADALFSLLERRLDNVVYRLHFANTRLAARQLVSHRHILVNGNKVNIPSYQVKIGDVITLTPKALAIPYIKKTIEEKNVKIPQWMEREAVVGKIKGMPSLEDVTEPISAQDVIEFYSK